MATAGRQPLSGQRPRLAVLIDAENISHRLAAQVFDLVAPLGEAPIRRIYGDFKGSADSWTEAAARHALEARHCFAPARGKNGADIALTVDAMDLLRDGAMDGICIVSSDGDFAALARRIRNEERSAFGLGCSTTPHGFRASCTQFFCLNPVPAVAAMDPRAALEEKIRKVLAGCPMRAGWYHLGEFGTCAKAEKLVPTDHGAASLSKLLKATGKFTFRDAQNFRPATQLQLVAGGQQPSPQSRREAPGKG
jgi:hypothetical protein